MTPESIILEKRNNKRPNTRDEMCHFIDSFIDGSGNVKDYQMTAWMMAICLNGMTPEETAHLTSAIVKSGEVLDWTSFPDDVKLVDKHSTGGVGDKISLILAPLVASFEGVKVPMMAGRGLGHTGGTIDKLEAIGMRTNYTCDEFRELVASVGAAIVSPSQSMVPADRKMYALRDVTGTVTSLPLQTSSIMSKKLAENPHSLVLDVKFGEAAFQDSAADGIELAKSLIAAGEGGGKQTTAFVTRMDHPIGNAVGNWLEVKECIVTMKSGKGPTDLVNLCLVEAAQMLLQSGAVPSKTLREGIKMARTNLENGKAFAKWREMVIAQGGDVSVVDDVESYPSKANFSMDVIAESDGYIANINAMEVGLTGVDVGAGRKTSDDDIDFTAGIYFHKNVGDQVNAGGDAVATVYGSDAEVVENAANQIAKSISYQATKVVVPDLITHFVTKNSVEEFDMTLLAR